METATIKSHSLNLNPGRSQNQDQDLKFKENLQLKH